MRRDAGCGHLHGDGDNGEHLLPELRGIIDDGSPCRHTKTQLVAHVLVDEHLRRRHPRSLSRAPASSCTQGRFHKLSKGFRSRIFTFEKGFRTLADGRVLFPVLGKVKYLFFGLAQPFGSLSSYGREGHPMLSQLFDWQRSIYHNVYFSNGSW